MKVILQPVLQLKSLAGLVNRVSQPRKRNKKYYNHNCIVVKHLILFRSSLYY